MFTISENSNLNYLCQIVKIQNLEKVENSDNLLRTIVQGNSIIVNKSVKKGDNMIYFPLECQIQDWYLKKNNLYSTKDLNEDPTKKGFIDKNGRVKCVKLRNQPSQGLLMPLSSLDGGCDWDVEKDFNNIEFDTFNRKLLVKKYVVKNNVDSENFKLKPCKKTKTNKFSKVIENQFNYHVNTPPIGKKIDDFFPTSVINITKKLHGTSGVSSYVLCNKPITFGEKTFRFISNNLIVPMINLFGGRIGKLRLINQDYDYIYSSRKVIKNDFNQSNKGFYGVDVWKYAHDHVSDLLKKGMSMYYEIVGYLPNGTGIQSGFDYGCVPPRPNERYTEGKHFKVFIYRITMTNPDGHVVEYGPKQVQEYCKRYMLKPVPVYFYGVASGITPFKIGMSIDMWQNEFLEELKLRYLEKDCSWCINKVPDEGVVVRKEGLDLNVYKLKSFKFLQHETSELDKGLENIEDIEN